MAYNTSKGKRDLGDIEYEGDPDTQIDFENDTIRLRTSDKIRFSVAGAIVKAEHPVTASDGFLVYDKTNSIGVASINSQGALSSSTYISASTFRGLAQRVTFPIKTVTSAYTVSIKDYTILADTSAGNITVEMPTAATASGKVYNIKKINSLNTLTITSSAGSTIDSAPTKQLTTLNESVTVHSNGTYWFVI